MANALLEWFSENARPLPWRRTQDPYAIWVSEIMLQQTQVAAVLPYYERWMRELPDVAALANAPEHRLLKLWEGLGYYTRVRNLQRAALQILEKHNGSFPNAYDDVLALPGIGPYTAGAICSIAFDHARPILDGNVARVLARVHAIPGDPRSSRTATRLWKAAEKLVYAAHSIHPSKGLGNGRGNCGKLNESLMELGALVCTPVNPACGRCPLKDGCLARQKARVQAFPGVRKRSRSTQHQINVFIAVQGKSVLVRQRLTGSVNAGFWEFPHAEGKNGEAVGDSLKTALPNAKATCGPCLGSANHTIMTRRMRLHVYKVRVAGVGMPGTFELRSLKAVAELPMSTISRKALAIWNRDKRVD